MKDDGVYLRHIADCIARIKDYTGGGQGVFLDTPLIQDGVIRNFEVIGEATRRLSQDLKDRESDVPWRRLGAFRNVLIHEYMGVDLEAVWNIVEHDLPALEAAIEALLRRGGVPST